MSDEILHEIACPNCRNAIDIREHGQHIVCDACGSRFLLQGHLCPNCGTFSAEEQTLCGQCGLALNRVCRKCSTINWTGNEYCISCGTPLDILEILARLGQSATASRLDQQMLDARHIREIEGKASEKRMAELMAIEEARQIELKRRLQKQKEQERQLLILIFSAVALFLIVLVIYAIITTLG